jgi:hypothetical protein
MILCGAAEEARFFAALVRNRLEPAKYQSPPHGQENHEKPGFFKKPGFSLLAPRPRAVSFSNDGAWRTSRGSE